MSPVEAIREALHQAEAAVAAHEAVPMGDAWADQDQAAETAIDELGRLARPEVFTTEIHRFDQAVFSAFDLLERSLAETQSGYAAGVIDAHARSALTYPEFAAFLRSPMVMARVHAAVDATDMRQYGRRSSAAAALRELVEPVERAMASHLLAGDDNPAAVVLAEELPSLSARLAASRQAREEFARAEVERATAEHIVADEVTASAERDLRRELATFFSGRASRVFNLRSGYVLSGAGAAAIAAGESARDAIDQMFVSAPLAELEQLRVETEAAEAAGQR